MSVRVKPETNWLVYMSGKKRMVWLIPDTELLASRIQLLDNEVFVLAGLLRVIIVNGLCTGSVQDLDAV